MLSVRRDIRLAIVGLVFVVIAWHILNDLDSVPFHGDESWWTTSSYNYTRLVINRDFAVQHWLNPTTHKWNDILNMPVGKYFIGFAMYVALPEGQYFYDYNWGKSLEQNEALGNVPSLEVLRPGRFISALISFLTCILMFFFCARSWNWIVGVLGALILAFNPVFSLAAKRVMTDSFFLFFMMLCEIACVAILSNAGKSKKLFVVCALAGTAAGLCASVKVNGLVVLLHDLLVFLFLSLAAFQTKRRVRQYIGAIFILLVSSAVVTILVNPFLYSWSPRVIVARYFYILSNWNLVFVHHQAVYSRSAIHGFPWIVFQRVFNDYFPLPLAFFLIPGVFVSMKKVLVELRAGNVSVVLAPLILFWVNLIFFAALIPQDWDRYYLPILCAEVPVAAFGIFWTMEKSVLYFRSRGTQTRAGVNM